MSIKRTIITTLVALAVVAVVAPGVTSAISVSDLQAQIAALQAQLSGLSTTSTGTGACAGVTFTRNLTVGATGSDVKCLQSILNQSAATQVATTGAGAPGFETTTFGPKTLVAVKKWQAANGMTPANQVGPMSRAKLNSALGTTVVVTPGQPPVVTPVGGALAVATAYDNPAAASIANNGSTGSAADFLKFTLTAGANQVNISKLYVTRTGLSTNNAVSNIKVVDNATGAYVGSIGSLNSNNQALITFTQGLIIPAGASKEFVLRATIGNTTNAPAGNTVALSINGSDITSTASAVTGSAQGNAMSSVAITTGTVAITEDGSTVNSSPNVGATGVTLNQFTLAAGSAEDVTVQAITMLKAGTISNSYLANLTLYDVTKGTTLAAVSSLNADGRATFGNLNLVVAKGGTERFRILADIVDGPSQTANADIIDGSDTTLVVVKGNTYGFYITPTAGGWSGKGTADQTVQAGGLTISKSSLTPATGNTSAGSDKVLAVLDLNASGEAMKVSSLKLTGVLTTMVYGEVTSVKIYDENGSIVAGPQDLLSDSTVTFTDTFIVPVGIHHYTVKGKIASTVSTGDTLKIGVATGSTDVTATGMTDNASVSVSGSSVYGNVLTVKAAAILVTTNNQPASRHISTGAQGVTLGSFTLSAGSSGEDVQVTSITVTDAGSTTYGFRDLSNVALYQGTTRISQTYNPTASATTQAFPLTTTLTIPVGGSVNVTLVGDLKASVDGGTTTIVMEVTTSGITANGASTGTTIASPTYSITNATTLTVATSGGTLTVSKDPSTAVSDLILGDSTVTLGVFKLAANDVEDLQVNEINLTVSNGQDVASYSFYNGNSLLGTASGSTTTPKLTLGSGALTVPANGNVKLTVKGTMAHVDGTTISTAGVAVTATVQGTNAVKANGMGSGAEVTTLSYQSAIANTMELVKAKPTVTVDSASPSGSAVGGTKQLVAIFDVTNAGADDITMSSSQSNSLILQVSKSIGTSVNGNKTWYLYDEAGTLLASSSFNEALDSSVTFSFASSQLTVSPNSMKKLYVYGNTVDLTHTSNGTDRMQLYINDTTSNSFKYSVANGTAIDATSFVAAGGIYAGSLSY